MEYYESVNGTNSSCNSKFSSPVFQVVAIVRALSGSISVVASLLVILLIVSSKKYLFFTQRLILYLSIASMLNGLAIALQGATYYPQNRYSDIYCSISAFLEQTTHWSLLLAVSSITVDIYLKAVHRVQSRGKIVYVVVIFLSPFVFNWIPFIHSAYGTAGPWCWITTDCQTNKYGAVYQYVLWYVPLYTVLLGIIAIYVIVYASVRRQKKQYHGHFDPERELEIKQMMEEIIPLIYYPMIFLLLQIPPTMNRIAELANDNEQVPLWLLHAFFSPLQGGLVCVVYALDPETRARIRHSSWKTLFRYSKFEDGVSEYPAVRAKSDSVSESSKMVSYSKHDSSIKIHTLN